MYYSLPSMADGVEQLANSSVYVCVWGGESSGILKINSNPSQKESEKARW